MADFASPNNRPDPPALHEDVTERQAQLLRRRQPGGCYCEETDRRGYCKDCGCFVQKFGG